APTTSPRCTSAPATATPRRGSPTASLTRRRSSGSSWTDSPASTRASEPSPRRSSLMAETATTLVELMSRRVSAEPDTAYFHLYNETVTYGQLWHESGRYAAGLREAGVDRGDKVCLIYPTSKEVFFTFFA